MYDLAVFFVSSPLLLAMNEAVCVVGRFCSQNQQVSVIPTERHVTYQDFFRESPSMHTSQFNDMTVRRPILFQRLSEIIPASYAYFESRNSALP